MRANRYIIDPIKPRDKYVYCHMELLKPLRFAHRLYLYVSHDSHYKNTTFVNKVSDLSLWCRLFSLKQGLNFCIKRRCTSVHEGLVDIKVAFTINIWGSPNAFAK
jgi:hypothetical protein